MSDFAFPIRFMGERRSEAMEQSFQAEQVEYLVRTYSDLIARILANAKICQTDCTALLRCAILEREWRAES